MPVLPYRPHPRHLCLFIVAYVLGCGFAQARNRSRNRYFHLVSERAFHCHARSGSEAELAMVGASGMFRRAAQQSPVVPQPFACRLPDICRQRPRGGGRCLAGQLGLEAIDPIGNVAGGYRFRRAVRGSCTAGERDRGKRDTRLVRNIFARLRRRLAALVDRRRHRRLDRCTAGVDRDPELATRLSSRRPDGQKPASLG